MAGSAETALDETMSDEDLPPFFWRHREEEENYEMDMILIPYEDDELPEEGETTIIWWD